MLERKQDGCLPYGGEIILVAIWDIICLVIVLGGFFNQDLQPGFTPFFGSQQLSMKTSP